MVTADKLAVQQLREAYTDSSWCPGAYIGYRGQATRMFDCPGSEGNRIYHMRTCRVCASHIMLRRALKRMGIEIEES